MLVFDETRMMSSNPEGLSQFENLVRRDRNHPSVFMWSMGNEEGTANTESGVRDSHRDEGSRHAPRWIAACLHRAHRRNRHRRPGGLRRRRLQLRRPRRRSLHKAHPDKPVIGTETVSAVCTRGIYVTDYDKGYVGSYDPYTTTGRASAEGWWRFCDARPWLAGGFVWTGFDYRGEPSPNGWPNIGSQYGVIDTLRIPAKTPSTTTSRGGPPSPCFIFFPTGIGPDMKASRSPSGSTPTWTR